MRIRHVLAVGSFAAVAGAATPGLAWATVQTPTTGQPGTSAGFNCGPNNSAPVEPGNAASAPGSAFNENGGTAGSVYAGSGSGSAHANSTAAVSQYDSACRQLTAHASS